MDQTDLLIRDISRPSLSAGWPLVTTALHGTLVKVGRESRETVSKTSKLILCASYENADTLVYCQSLWNWKILTMLLTNNIDSTHIIFSYIFNVPSYVLLPFSLFLFSFLDIFRLFIISAMCSVNQSNLT